MSDLPCAISLREVGPRDRLQNEAPVPTAAKVELLDALSATGVRDRGRQLRLANCHTADG
jgi:hydroxymethylglutaryl-CoA lyase